MEVGNGRGRNQGGEDGDKQRRLNPSPLFTRVPWFLIQLCVIHFSAGYYILSSIKIFLRCSICFFFKSSYSFQLLFWAYCHAFALSPFFGEMTVQSLGPYFNLSVCCWVVGVLYMSCINPLSDIWFANTFSHSIGCFSTLFIVSINF